MARFKFVVRDSVNDCFSDLPYPLKQRLRNPVRQGDRAWYVGRRNVRYFSSKSEARKTLLANWKQNAGILTPADLGNIKLVKANWRYP